MVCIDSGQFVYRQLLVRKERSVTVNGLVLKERKLRKHPLVCVHNGFVIHYLAETEYPLVSYKRIHIVRGKHAAVVIDICRRYA